MIMEYDTYLLLLIFGQCGVGVGFWIVTIYAVLNLWNLPHRAISDLIPTLEPKGQPADPRRGEGAFDLCVS